MSDQERSISSGRSFPQWMKPQAGANNFDGTASPPAHDDSFFYIRYPIADKLKHEKQSLGSNKLKSLTDAISDLDTNTKMSIDTQKSIADKSMIKSDFTEHTEPCKLFLDNGKNDSAAPPPAFSKIKNQTKPFGTDDGFKGPGAACGSSIVKVARQMVSGKPASSVARGFTVASFKKDIDDHGETPDNQSEADIDLMFYQQRYTSMRRGSKSLPSSPLSSPKSMRKVQPNPYFTGQFSMVPTSSQNDTGRSWFFSSLLGVQREAISTTSVVSSVSEEVEETLVDTQSATGSASSPSTSSPTSTSAAANRSTYKVLKAKPSELREMNFWSPTSM